MKLFNTLGNLNYFGLFCNWMCLCLCLWQWDGEVSIWGSRTTPILSQEGVGEQMGRNGGAREMPLWTRSIVSGTWTEDAIVQESLWKANQAMPSPAPPILPPVPSCCLMVRHQKPRLCPETVHPTALALRTKMPKICILLHPILLQRLTISTGEKKKKRDLVFSLLY